MLGLPRWFFRDALASACSYAKSICRRDRSEAFFYELRLRRFLMLVFEAGVHGFGIKIPTGPSGEEHAFLDDDRGIDTEDAKLSVGSKRPRGGFYMKRKRPVLIAADLMPTLSNIL